MPAGAVAVGADQGETTATRGDGERYRVMATHVLDYCRRRNWAGADPYDVLNSRRLDRLGVLEFKAVRLALTQLVKRLPWDLRGLLDVPAGQNAKGLGLFLQALNRLLELNLLPDPSLIDDLTERLLQMRSPGVEKWCWGYHFPWQTRTELIARNAPNAVCSVFVAGALLDAHSRKPDARVLAAVESCCEYLVDDLYREQGGQAFFAYPPNATSAIHNANFLAAALLSRSARACGRSDFLAPARAAVRFSISRQRSDGSWLYGESPAQGWIDNFHTGFNLSALRMICDQDDAPELAVSMRAGLGFYLDHFFLPDGAPRYFHDCTYPLDIHCVAQSILTLADCADLDARCLPTMHRVAAWAADRMYDTEGYFYYRQLRWLRNRIPYMRWSQAWMLLALARLIEVERMPAPTPEPGPRHDAAATSA